MYIEIFGDYIEPTHIELFQRALNISAVKNKKLIIGIAKDKYCSRYGMTPKKSFNERKNMILSCNLVNDVIEFIDRRNLEKEMETNKIDIICTSFIDNNMDPIDGKYIDLDLDTTTIYKQPLVVVSSFARCNICKNKYPSHVFKHHLIECSKMKGMTSSSRCSNRIMTIWHLQSCDSNIFETYCAIPQDFTLIDFDNWFRTKWFDCCVDHRSVFTKDSSLLFHENDEVPFEMISENEIQERIQHIAEKLYEFCIIYTEPCIYSFNPLVLCGDEGNLFRCETDDMNSEASVEIIYEDDMDTELQDTETVNLDDTIEAIYSYMSPSKRYLILQSGEDKLVEKMTRLLSFPSYKDDMGLYRFVPYVINKNMEIGYSLKTTIKQVSSLSLVYEYDEFDSSKVFCTPVGVVDVKAPKRIVELIDTERLRFQCVKCNSSASCTNYCHEIFWCNKCKPEKEHLYSICNTPRMGRCSYHKI